MDLPNIFNYLSSNESKSPNEQPKSPNEQPKYPNEQSKVPNEQPKSPLTPKIVDSNARIVRLHDLEMDYNENGNDDKKMKKIETETPNEEVSGDLGGWIVGIGNGIGNGINDISNGITYMLSPPKEKIDESIHDHHPLKTNSIDESTEAVWTSRPGTPERKH